ncbi:hypothetical protein LF599_04585 [Pseudodesulfovibrio thermohalotolerans]|uniref:hypothetical protein n=1 Tax=Pseudodesulfovibrio thermohalotolerans TaxID=2880651 RepID=UPI002442A0DD|nr:hypothetical protein [Pseudodesulfovibrio thermohalotolerans]WFS63445.1 hypothetical protein LF599_04585 [Pseudodesulfovibrio thermohalotolerans]
MFKTILPLLALFLLLGCGGSDFPDDISDLNKDQLATAIIGIDKEITAVDIISLGNNRVRIEIATLEEALWDDASAITYPLILMEKICKSLFQAKGNHGIKSIWFKVSVHTVDAYGNESSQKIYTLSFDQADLQRINWANSDLYMLSNFATILEISPIGEQSFIAYCQEDGKRSPTLCRQLY